MEIFGSATQNQSEFMRHSVHTYNLAHSEQVSTNSTTSISHSQTMSLSPSRIAPATVSPPNSPNISVKPPALPPKRQRINSKTASIASTPPASPKIFQDQHHQMQHHYQQQQQQPVPTETNTSPSPSTSSLVSTRSGAAVKPSPACNQNLLDVKSSKVSQATYSPDAEASASATTTSSTTTTTTTITSTGGCVFTTVAATEKNTYSSNSTNRSFNAEHPNANDDYLHLCDATTDENPVTGVGGQFSSSVSNKNLATIVTSCSGGSKTLISDINHGHGNNGSSSSNNNVESSSYLNDSHNTGRTSSSSSGLSVLPSSDAIYESTSTTLPIDDNNKDGDEVEVILRRNNNKNGITILEQQQPLNLMEELDVSNYLVFKKENEDGPDVKGGHPDALIIHATRVQKNSDGKHQTHHLEAIASHS
uniref:Uncharacterized protein n=1 Tax=Anopheles maculatus TaxID=74869 RepID=A0A182SH87_9DIPT